MHDFDSLDITELGLIGAVLSRALEIATETDTPPVISAHLESALAKIEVIFDNRVADLKKFDEIAESLGDLKSASQIIEKDIEADLPEYN